MCSNYIKQVISLSVLHGTSMLRKWQKIATDGQCEATFQDIVECIHMAWMTDTILSRVRKAGLIGTDDDGESHDSMSEEDMSLRV